jgi:hypothetical protein
MFNDILERPTGAFANFQLPTVNRQFSFNPNLSHKFNSYSKAREGNDHPLSQNLFADSESQ